VPDVARTVAGYQVELFQHVAEFFGRATGMPAPEFATIEGFDDKIRSDATRVGHRSVDAFSWADRELRAFYAKNGIEIFRLASQLGGMKFVLGGSSRFGGSHLASVRGSLLYADTILIPDPVFPWLETKRAEEKFRHVLMLKAAHTLLHLKDIVDADLAHCPVLVFPSWEKLLEENDPQTQRGTLQMLADVFANFIDPVIATPDDTVKLAREQPDKVLEAIERHRLFVAPGGPVGEPVMDALARYENDIRTWRSAAWLSEFDSLQPAAKVIYAVMERLGPQYHLLENSEELRAHPLLAIEQQAHYFKVVSHVNSGRLERIGLLDKQTKATLAGLGSQRLSFLSNVPIAALVEVRRNNDNEEFRKRLNTAVTNLHESAIEDIDRVAGEICREIDSGIADHNRAIRDIDDKFRSKNTQTAGAGALTAVALLWPTLAPFIGAALPIGVVAKLGWDAWDKYKEKKKLSRSLMGLLAVAKSVNDRS
jgi:hypothetical protein